MTAKNGKKSSGVGKKSPPEETAKKGLDTGKKKSSDAENAESQKDPGDKGAGKDENQLTELSLAPNDLFSQEELQRITDMIEAVHDDDFIALVMHKSPAPDSDAISSTFCLREFIRSRNKRVKIIGVGNISHTINKNLLKFLDMEEDIRDDRYFEKHKQKCGLVIDCDTKEGRASVPAKPDIIIDHHREETKSKKCVLIDRNVGAASTIVQYFLKAVNFNITSDMALALMVGIVTDTKHLTKEKEVKEEDKTAFAECLRLCADRYNEFAKICIKWQKPKSLIDILFPNSEIWGNGHDKVEGRSPKGFFPNVLICGQTIVIGVGEYTTGQSDNMAFIADMVEECKAYDLVVVLGIIDGIVKMTKVRSDIEALNENIFCKKIFGESAGGRMGSGGAMIKMSEWEIHEWQAAKESGIQDQVFSCKLKAIMSKIQNELKEVGVE